MLPSATDSRTSSFRLLVMNSILASSLCFFCSIYTNLSNVMYGGSCVKIQLHCYAVVCFNSYPPKFHRVEWEGGGGEGFFPRSTMLTHKLPLMWDSEIIVNVRVIEPQGQSNDICVRGVRLTFMELVYALPKREFLLI